MSNRQFKPTQPTLTTTTNQSRSLALTLGAAVLLMIGGGAGFWLLRGQDAGGKLPVGADVIPQNVLLSVTVSTDSGQWQKLAEFGTKASRNSWRQGVRSLEGQILKPSGLNFDNQIRPWVGGTVTMAFLNPTIESVESVNQQETVWVLPIRDRNQATQLFTSPQPIQGSSAKKRTYKTVEIREFQTTETETIAMAMLDQRFMAFTNVAASMNQIIDTYKQSTPSLAQTPRYQTAMNTIQVNRPLAQVFVNLPAATAQITASGNRQLSPTTVERIQEAQGLGSTVSLEADGVQIKTISWLKPEAKQKLKVENTADNIAKYLPQDTLMMASGGNFLQVWRDYAQGAEAKLVFPFNPKDWSNSLEKSLGIDFNNDFVTWMDDDFAGALVPSENQKSQGVGIVLMAKAGDRKAADQALRDLDDAVRERYDFQVAESTIGNKTVITWKVPPGLPIASHGWLNKDITFLTLGSPVANRIVKPPKTNLSQSKLFQDTTRSQLQPNNGHFFIDMPRTLKLMQNSPLLPKLSPKALEFAQAMDAIGVTAAINNSWSSRYDIRIKLKKE